MELTEHRERERESELDMTSGTWFKQGEKKKISAKYVGTVSVCLSSVLESCSWVLCPSETELVAILCVCVCGVGAGGG